MGVDEQLPNEGKRDSVATKRRARWPKHALLACFFLLGMGLITFTNATKQTADYFNARYKGMYTNRMVDTCYTAGFMVTLFVLFFSGPDTWPNKRARMYHGYTVFLAALVVPTLIDTLVGELATGAHEERLRPALAPWAVSALIGGAAEATVASVLNGEAAALGCNTAASYGKSVGGVFIVGLRLAVKALLPGAAGGDLGRLRLGVCIHLAIAAAILLACVLVTTFVIPHLVDLVQQTESADIPPGLTFQQTLNTAYTVVQGGPQGEAAAAALQAACSLAPMQPTIGSTFGLPLMEIRRLGGFSMKLSRVDSIAGGGGGGRTGSVLLPPAASSRLPTAHGKLDADMRHSLIHGYIEQQHAGTFKEHNRQHRRRSSSCSSPSDCLSGSSRCTTPVKPPLGTTAHATVHAAAEATAPAGEQHTGGLMRAPSMRRQLSSVLGRRSSRRRTSETGSWRTPRESQRATPPPLSPLSIKEDEVSTDATRPVVVDHLAATGGQHTAQHEQASRAADAAQASLHGLGLPSALDIEQQQQQQQHLTCVSLRHVQTSKHHQGGSGDRFSQGSLSPSPLHSQHLSAYFDDLDEGAVKIQLREVLGACWVVMKTVLVFQVAILIIPNVNEQNRAMVSASIDKGTVVDPYYAQLVELAKLMGSMLGSQFVPVFHPRKPKLMLLAMSAAITAFLAAFAVSRQFGGGPAVMVKLIFFSYAYGGHLNSTAFTLATEDLPADDSRMAQMVLALTAAVGSWQASCLSWLWVGIPPV